MIRIADDLAFEMLDDGGILFCVLREGAYWQLSAPAGRLWTWINERPDFAAVCDEMVKALGDSRAESEAGLGRLCEELLSRGIITSYHRS